MSLFAQKYRQQQAPKHGEKAARTAYLPYILVGLAVLALMAIPQGLWSLFDDAQRITALAKESIQPLGAIGYLVYTFLAALGMCVFIPRQALSFVGGALFGAFIGSVLAILACVLACGLATALGRCIGRSWLEKHAPKPLAYLDALLTNKPILAAISLRLLPTGNNLVFSYLGGVSTAPAWAFILGSGIGYIPQNVLFSLLGAGSMLPKEGILSISIAASAIALLLAYYIYTHTRSLIDDTWSNSCQKKP